MENLDNKRSVSDIDIEIIKSQIATSGKGYIIYLEREFDAMQTRLSELSRTDTIQKYETDMAINGESFRSALTIVKEYISLVDRVEAMKEYIDVAKSMLGSNEQEKGLK